MNHHPLPPPLPALHADNKTTTDCMVSPSDLREIRFYVAKIVFAYADFLNNMYTPALLLQWFDDGFGFVTDSWAHTTHYKYLIANMDISAADLIYRMRSAKCQVSRADCTSKYLYVYSKNEILEVDNLVNEIRVASGDLTEVCVKQKWNALNGAVADFSEIKKQIFSLRSTKSGFDVLGFEDLLRMVMQQVCLDNIAPCTIITDFPWCKPKFAFEVRAQAPNDYFLLQCNGIRTCDATQKSSYFQGIMARLFQLDATSAGKHTYNLVLYIQNRSKANLLDPIFVGVFFAGIGEHEADSDGYLDLYFDISYYINEYIGMLEAVMKHKHHCVVSGDILAFLPITEKVFSLCSTVDVYCWK